MVTVLGSFETREAAASAVDHLIAEGFRPEDISVLQPGGKPADVTPENEPAHSVAKGAGIGAAIGGFGSILAGAASLAVPGIGPLLALGWLGGALTAAIGGGLIGGMVGFLVAQGVPKEEASFYAERVKAGAYVVAVRTDEAREPKARLVLAEAGAEGPIQERAA